MKQPPPLPPLLCFYKNGLYVNIAIYGGSFDPVHKGHEAIIKELSKLTEIDRLFVVPTYLNPFKSTFHFTPEQRYSLLKELLEDEAKAQVCDFEIRNNKATPTIETVKYLKNKYKPENTYVVIGADNLEKLHLWKDFEELNQLVKFIVVTRNGYEAKNDIIRFKRIDLDINISSTYLRDDLNLDYIPTKIVEKVLEYGRKNK